MVSSLSIEKLKRDAYRLGAEDMRERLVAALAGVWVYEHGKNCDDRMGDGSPDVIDHCISLARALPIEQHPAGPCQCGYCVECVHKENKGFDDEPE